MTDQIGNTNVPQLIDNKPIEIILEKVRGEKKKLDLEREKEFFLRYTSFYISIYLGIDRDYNPELFERVTSSFTPISWLKTILALSDGEIITLVEHILEKQKRNKGFWTSLWDDNRLLDLHDTLQKNGIDIKALVLDSVNEARKKAGIVVDLEEKGIYKGETV